MKMELNNDLHQESLSFKFPLHHYEGIPLDLNIDKVFYGIEEVLDLEVFEDNYLCEKTYEIEQLSRNFNFIDVETKLYENRTKNFLEYNELESVDELLFKLDEFKLKKLNNYIDKYKLILQRICRRRLDELFRLKQKEPKITLKNKFPKLDNEDEISKFTVRDRTFMLAQLSIEYNPTPIFPENKNKTMQEWSFREKEYHMAYISSKTRIENVENMSHAKKQEISYEQNKGDK